MTSALAHRESENSLGPLSGLDRIGRRITCAICERPLEYAGNGRPRVICRRKACIRLRHYQNAHPAPRWSDEDFVEAAQLWRRCASCNWLMLCREGRVLYPSRQHPLLPVCSACLDEKPDAAARRWLDRVKPGCPLPNPFHNPGGTHGQEEERHRRQREGDSNHDGAPSRPAVRGRAVAVR